MKFRIFDRNVGLAKSMIFNVSEKDRYSLPELAKKLIGSHSLPGGQGDFVVQELIDKKWVNTDIEWNVPVLPGMNEHVEIPKI